MAATALLLLAGIPARAQWTQPTPEELTMTAQPQAPGAAAIYLYREEATDDSLHVKSYYVRLKILTEAGKEYANVRALGGSFMTKEDLNYDVNVTDIEGRTIHSDGTVVPFTGKPYMRTVEKKEGEKVTEKVFTLPDVQVGSILEYRYKTRIGDEWYSSPEWLVQQDLFARKAYFSWKATDDTLIDSLRNEPTSGIAWTQNLPAGTQVTNATEQNIERAGHIIHHFEVNLQNVPPIPEEEYMPPVASFTYRVSFYYAVDSSGAEFWKNEGKAWAKKSDHFIGSPGSLQDAISSLVAPADTNTVKLKKIYAAVMAMENTDFSREHDKVEDKAEGLQQVKSAQDIWQRKRGTGDELTLLFIGLARAAGMKAYDMRVTDRDRNAFSPAWLTMRQLHDDIAIVVLDGQEQYFDPGQRYCPFEQLAWIHTSVGGLRETDGGTSVAGATPVLPYMQSQTKRIGDLALNADGTVQGALTISWMGAPALEWRQRALRSDQDDIKRKMREWLEKRVPAGLTLDVTSLDNLENYEQPLTANFTVHGQLATVTSKRLVLPGEFFEAESKPLFPAPTREIAVYFPYASRTLDGVRVKYPQGWQLESAPKVDSVTLPAFAAYQVRQDLRPNSVQINRIYDLATFYFLPKEYADARTFYNKVAAEDQQSIVLLATDAQAGQAALPSNAGHN